MGRSQIVFDVDPYLRDKFQEICRREGESMSRKFRQWMMKYVLEHEKGNPQALLTRDPSILEQLIEEDTDVFQQPTPTGRKSRLEYLKENLDRYPRQPKKVALAFMAETGLSARIVEEYMRVLGKPVPLTPKRRKRNY